MRDIDEVKKFYIQTFHSSTYPTDLYGTSTINNNQIVFNKGPLTRALIEGKFYIADELNISPISTILSIAPILDLIFETRLIIPGMVSYEKKFKISSSFFLIICQNNVGIIGRSELPSSLMRKIRKIKYPELEAKEIEKICNDIDEFLSNNKENKNKNIMIGKEESEKIGKCMIEINKEKIFQDNWSLRDVTKLIKRLQYQKDKKNTFQNFQLQHNLLFYALSRYTLTDKKKYLDKFCDILKRKHILNLDENKFNDLKETLNSETKLLEDPKDDKITFLLKKKDLTIVLYENEINDGNKNEIGNITRQYRDIQSLNNLLESLFQMKLTSYKEPILLIGPPTCYKSFAAKIILKNATIVSLNKESTILQLLGSPFFFTQNEHKIFCLSQIYEILGLTNFKQKLNECRDWENNEITIKNELEKIIKKNKNKKIYSDLKIKLVKNIKKKLFSDESENRLIDLKMEFKPGLILNAIFTDKSLILKNISKVKTSVLERFNELFSDKNILTLSEDTTNTFTSEKNKELKNFQNFRIIATSRLNEEITLSEAILSRFTKINVEEYNEKEKKIVLNKKAGDNINLINELDPDLEVPEILNSIHIGGLLDKSRKNHKKNLQLIFYIIENGKKEKNDNLDNSLNKKYEIPEFKDNEFPFERNLEENKIISKRTELKYDYKNNDFNGIFKNIYFTKKFSEICDLIHFSCTLHIPLILEGENGQGKKTAVNLMAQLFELDVIHKVLSKSLKSDELLMNTVITKNDNGTILEYKKTDISEALEEKNSNKIIIFDEINNASLPVLDLLTNIFVDKKCLLPDGTELKVGNVNIIGIININNNEALLDRIPLNLKYNCIYHKVENPNAEDFSKIITKLFSIIDYDKNSKKEYIQNYLLNHESMNDEQRKDIVNDQEKYLEFYNKGIKFELNYFAKKFIDLLKYTKKNSIEPEFNLIDIKKYIDFRRNFPKLDSLYLMLFVFVYRFDKPEIQEKIIKSLDLNLTSDFSPYIDYDENQKKLIIYLGKNNFDKIEIKTINSGKINKKENKRLFKSLTKIQKLGIIFLVCCVQSGKIPLIQGETASGKSYLINIFSQLFGQDMILYQITNNSGMSIITGQDIIKTDIGSDEENELKKSYKNIRKLIKEKRKFNEIAKDDYQMILNKISNTLKNTNNNDDKKKLEKAKNDFRDIIFLRLEHNTSSFINAAENGGWVCFDGIEMGHSILFDTIASLCGENPQLNVLGSKETIILNKKKFDPNFKLFLTFNPSNLGKKSINQILYNLCARFSLTSLDTYTTDSTIVIYNCRYEDKINQKLWGKICSKIASCHKINVEKSEEFVNLMAGGVKFSPRHLTFLGIDGKKNSIPERSEDICNWIKTIFQLYYFNSFSKDNAEFTLKKLENEVYDEFIKNENFNELENIFENKLELEVKNVLEDLSQIQKSNEQNIFNFNFRSFVNKCFKIKLKEDNIKIILNNIEDTLNLLNYQNNSNNYKNYNETLSNYFQINIIKQLFQELYEQMKKIELIDLGYFSLESKELLTKKELKLVLIRMKLLFAMLNDEELFTDKLNYKIYDNRFQNLISIFKSFIENPNKKKGFIKLIKDCSDNSSLFEIIDFFFPKHKLYKNKDYDLIILYINTICELVRNKNYFSIEIDKTSKYFYNKNKKNEYGKIQAELCLNKKNSFILTAGTKIKIPLINMENNEFEIKKDFEDSETIIKFINEYAPKKNINKKIAEIYNNFNKKRRKNEEKIKYFSSEYFFNPEKNTNIYSRAWSIIFGLTPKNELYQFLILFYFEEERNFFRFVENKYQHIDETEIEEIIRYFKIRFFYYNKNSFLWGNKIKNINLNNLNKDDIESKLIDIRKEIQDLKILENSAHETKDISEDKLNLLEIQKLLEKRKYQIELDEEYRKAEKKLNMLKNELNALNVQSNFEIWKLNLIKKINDAFNLSREEMIKRVDILQNDYESLVTINEEKMFKNNIDWKIPSIKNANEKSTHIKLYDIILQYNSSLEVIKKIEQIKNENDKSNIIKVSSNLNQKNEMKSLLKYIISFQDYQNFDFEYANSICRASLMLNIYKNNISKEDLTNFFNDIDEKKNRKGQILLKKEFNENEEKICIEKNKLLQNEFIYVFKITGLYDLNMDIIIPNFKVADLIHIYFNFENFDKFYFGPAFDNIEILNNENLYEHLYKNVKNEIKNLDNFQNIAGKISLMFYRYFNKELVEIPEFLDGKKILEFIENKSNNLDKSSEKYKKLNALIDIIKLGIYFDDYKIYKEEIKKKNHQVGKNLNFEDFQCIKDNFDINSILNIKNFPSFQYFLLNNYNNIEALLKIVKKENINKLFEPSPYTFIPFWVFIIRIMSSTNCLTFENNNNPLEKELTKIIRNKILLAMENKEVTDLSWINLVTDENYNNIFNKKINMFYKFFNKICSLKSFSYNISEYINPLLTYIYDSLFDICLSLKFNNLLDTDIQSNKYSVLDFVKNPKEFIKKYINQNLSKILLSELMEQNCLNCSKTLEDFIIILNNAQKEIKEKVTNLEINLRNKKESDLIRQFRENNNREINADEKEELFRDFEPQRIYFDQYTVEEIIMLLKNTEQFLEKILDDIKKICNNEIIELNKFNIIYKNLRNNLDKFDSIYNVEDEYCDNDFKKYLENFQKIVNSFKNNFNIFSNIYQKLPKIDTDKIYMKDFSLPEFQKLYYTFDLNDIKENHELLAQPLIIKKNNKLFCNYKKIYFNTGPISPELYNELCKLKIYSLVNEILIVEIENKKEDEEINRMKEKKNIIKELEFEEDNEQKIIDLYDTKDFQYMKLKKSKIDPETLIEIYFSFPKPNTSKKEKIYRLKRNLKASINSSSIDILIEIIFIVCPIQIDFSCEKYTLTFENEQYKLNVNKLLMGEIINFKIHNNYENIPFVLKHTITSLDRNTSEQPDIQIKNMNELNLIIKNNKSNMMDIDILNCLLVIYISENIKIPILIDCLIIPTYFDFYVYDYETKNFVNEAMYMYIPNFQEQNEIELYFLVSIFSGVNITGLFKVIEISEGISIVESQDKIKLNLNENYFSIKIKFDLTKFNDNEIAIFEFSINNVSKRINIFQKVQSIENVDLKLIKKYENKKQIEIKNINDINKDSLLISPFTYWGKGNFLYRGCFINGKKDLELEIPQNSILYYLSNEGYINKEKENNYLLIIQVEGKWYSTIGLENYISQITFQHILMTNTNNFFDDFVKYFPNECKNIKTNLFETLSKLFLDKAKDLIKDKQYVSNLMKENEDINNISNINFYRFNKNNFNLSISKILENLIDKIKDAENENEMNINNDLIKEENKDINNISNKDNNSCASDNDSESESESDNLKKEFLNKKNNKINNSIIKENRFLIQNGVPIKDEPKNNLIDINDFNNLGKSEINSIEISEIKFIQIPKIVTINSLIKFFDECDLGTLILPLYVYKAKHSGKKEDQKNLNEYFSILSNAYMSLEKNNDNLISEYTNQFKKSFEYMMSKFMAVGFKSNIFRFPKLLKFKDSDMIFILPESGKFKIPNTIFSKNDKKDKRRNIENEIKQEENIINDKKEKINDKEENKNNLNEEDKEERLVNYKNKNINNENNNIFDNAFRALMNIFKSQPKTLMFSIPLPLVPLELPQEIQEIYIGYDLENKISNNKIKKNENNLLQKEVKSTFPITQDEFMETNNYNEMNEIKTIIENMKNLEKSQFLYKTEKNLIYLEDIKNDLDEKNEDEKEIGFLQTLVNLTIPITKVLIKEISIQNLQKEIPIKTLEINIIFDCTRIINTYHKYIYFILIIGLINALSYLEINYNFAIVGDSKFKAVIKDFNEPHSLKIIKRIFECITIPRYRTNIASCVKTAIEKFPTKDKNNKKIYYFFTNGLDDEYKLYDEWNKEIFDTDNSFFAFLFYVPSEDKEIKEKNEIDFSCVFEQLNEFSKKCNGKSNLFTFIIKNRKDIFDAKIINDNLIKLFIYPLISVQEQNIDITLYKPTFELLNDYQEIEKKIENVKKEFIDYEEINYEEEELFARKELFDFKYSIPEINADEAKEIKLNVGKIISLPFISNLSDFIKNYFKIPKEKINLQLLEIIFEPNLPTETILTDVGTQIDIYEFIKLCINPTPNPKIYRQLGDGFVKNYGLTIVIDSSYSCLGGISRDHAINTIRYLLSALSYIDLPSFNLIISTESNPIVICSEKGTLDALSNKSQIWGSLLYFLNEEYKCKNTNLSSAIRAAYNITNTRKQEHTDYLFVLTDGLFQKSEAKNICQEIVYCYSKNLLIIGIGLGYYPYGIEKLFPFTVYSRQPNKIIEAITLSFSDSKTNNYDLTLKDPNYGDLIDKIDNYFENFKNYESLSLLTKHLKDIPIFLNSFSIYSGEVKNNNQTGKLQTVKGPMKNAMYKEGSFKDKKILIVMLYSAEMNLRENPYLSYNYIQKPKPGKYYCIQRALDYLKIQVDYVIDYESAIEKLTENNNGFCNYYACLILSGEPYPELPKNNNSKAYLLGEFIKVVIQFWKNGGGLGLFSDNAPFTFQTNLILEKLFDGLQFRVGGFHEGKKILKGVDSGILEKKGTFNRKVHFINNYQRPLITHSLYEMYEGNTVSYIIENPNDDKLLYFGKNEKLKMITDPNKLLPFIPLSKDSDGGFNSLFYCSNGNEGDIIIDCSYTKFFLEMDKTGTPRYLMNICSWLAAIEKHIIKKDCKDGINFLPKHIDIKIDWNAKFNRFMERKDKFQNMKTLFAVDDSGSVYNQEVYFNKVLHLFSTNFKAERGDAFYIWNEENHKLDIEEFQEFINSMDGEKGTNSSQIAEIAKKEKNNKFEHLIIVTDGDVKKEEVDKSDQKFKEYNLHFSFVSTFIIDTGDKINESVGCPYSRDCPGFTYIVDSQGNQREQASLLEDDIEIFNNLDKIKTYDEFLLKYGNIYRIFRAKCLGRDTDEELKNIFINFKKKINVPKNKIKEFMSKIEDIEFMINGGLRNFLPIAC